MPSQMTPDPLTEALRQVAAVLDRLGILYLIGGSVASSTRGLRRATGDIDLVARIEPEHAAPLAAALGREWYAEPDQIRSAIAADRSFNLIHIPSSQKIDIFPANHAFEIAQLRRATKEPLEFLGEKTEFPIATAEDVLLAKLQWYRQGGEVSERQWNDIMGIVAINPELDRQYLETWAARLGVSELLARALAAQPL
jgi:hypothetical protein